MSTTKRPMEGVRILDLAGISGANGTRLLAALGAEVIVAEPPAGHTMRSWAPFVPGGSAPEGSLWWAYFAQGKKSVVVADLDELRALAATCDVVVEDAGVGVLDEVAASMGPEVVWISVTPFGRTGPRAHWKGSELVGWASSGLLHTFGFPDRPPVMPATPIQFGQHVLALDVALSAQLALRVRRRTGRGQRVDLSLQESLLFVGPETGAPLFLDDLVPRSRPGNRRAVSRPFGLYPCADGFVSVVVLQPAHWRAMAEWIRDVTGEDSLLEEAFFDIAVRWEAAEFVDAMTEAVTTTMNKLDLFIEGQRRNIPITPVNTVADLRNDPHLEAAGFWRSHEVHGTDGVVGPGAPFRVSADWWSFSRAPLLGEHTDVVLGPLRG